MASRQLPPSYDPRRPMNTMKPSNLVSSCTRIHVAITIAYLSLKRGIPDVPTAVARLLEETRVLQDALGRWGQYQMSETQVSDIFVRVGNDFNAAVAAFSVYRIDMTYVLQLANYLFQTTYVHFSDVMPFPDELRRVLEACLSGDPTPQNLNYYIPQVRTIIANLLIGLKNKQELYRQAVQAQGGRF